MEKVIYMATDCPGKGSWPELVGVNGTTAAAVIERENPNVKAMIVRDGIDVVTADFRCDRVWVWINADTGLVVRTPVIG